TGGFAGRVDSTFRTAVTSISVPVTVTFPAGSSAGGRVYIRVTAADGVNNTAVATDSIMLTNINALIVALARPLTGASTSAGKGIQVQVNAQQNNGVKKVGWISTGVVTASDSILPIAAAPALYPDTVIFLDTLSVPASVTSGTFSVVGFAEDSSGRRVVTPATVVTIQSVATDTLPPIVTFSVLKRVEVRDSIIVRASDPSGI